MSYNEIYYTQNYNTFDEWLKLVIKKEKVYPCCRIPYEEWVEEYIADIKNKSIEEVKNLLRCLLMPVNRKLDLMNYESYVCMKNSNDNKLIKTAIDMSHIEQYKRIENQQDAWEGLTWVLQLLPFSPYKAIKALNSYLEAEVCYMPDDRIIGINQCIAIIEGKFIYTNEGLENSILQLKPREFEWLIEILYKHLRYETILTPATRDGGKDIIARIDREDCKEKVYVECKLYKTTKLTNENVTSFAYRVIKDNIHRGVLFCTGYVNKKLRELDSRIQIWTLEEIIVLLNAHIGSDWDKRLELLIGNQRIKYKK
ncbi:restriction endonuclease [Clostridium sp. ZS2-4]|uniref:restriction endonuclease n=1 Tax=Clostridium sp. ZS2-4 TaxID=2987703 RepID=UPI00227BE455|nr:restriction endonuclease [Clostridium sp. ZS2-4]MCY6354385.1 restriction endonuclease [Clostridium sp. ZS2-4]